MDGVEEVFAITMVIGDAEVVIAVVSGDGGMGIVDVVIVCWAPVGACIGRTAFAVPASHAGAKSLAAVSCRTMTCSKNGPPVREVLSVSRHFVGAG